MQSKKTKNQKKLNKLKEFAENNEIPLEEMFHEMVNGSDSCVAVADRHEGYTMHTKSGYKFIYCILNTPNEKYTKILKVRRLQVSHPKTKKLPDQKILLKIAKKLGFDIEKSNIAELDEAKKYMDPNYNTITNTLSIAQIIETKKAKLVVVHNHK